MRQRTRSGAVFLPWLFIFLMIGSLVWLLSRLNSGIRNTDQCKRQLEQVYEYLLLYERDNGRLPVFKMYPERLEGDQESLSHHLRQFPGFDENWLICPSAPSILKETGITYLWNTSLNQSSLMDRKEITWVLVDMQALVDQVPGPHFGGVHILYSDGRVERSTLPPPGLPVQFETR